MMQGIFNLCIVLYVFCCSFTAQATEELTVAVASSLYEEMLQKSQDFEKKHAVHIRLISGSTGRLYNQIQQGAPFDVFIAADEIRPNLLLQQNKAMAKYTAGKGYLGLMIGDQLVSELKRLTQANIKRIAIANPEVAPFGLAAKKLLQQQGLWDILEPKFVYAQNALQSKMLVTKGLVDAAFIPVAPTQPCIATLNYIGVLLVDKSLAKLWLEGMRYKQDRVLALQLP